MPRSLPNFTLIALAASYCFQVGAGIFALAVNARTLIAAPPRSLAMLQGAYRYDSSAFWQAVPAITAILFLLAIIANWRTQRRSLLLGAVAVFLLTGVATVAFLEPQFAGIVATGYSDTVDPALQRRAAAWYSSDWVARCVDAVACLALLVALTRPSDRTAPSVPVL